MQLRTPLLHLRKAVKQSSGSPDAASDTSVAPSESCETIIRKSWCSFGHLCCTFGKLWNNHQEVLMQLRTPLLHLRKAVKQSSGSPDAASDTSVAPSESCETIIRKSWCSFGHLCCNLREALKCYRSPETSIGQSWCSFGHLCCTFGKLWNNHREVLMQLRTALKHLREALKRFGKPWNKHRAVLMQLRTPLLHLQEALKQASGSPDAASDSSEAPSGSPETSSGSPDAASHSSEAHSGSPETYIDQSWCRFG